MTNLEKWNFYLKDLESPQIFIDWSFYFTISSVLQRRVWYGKFNSGFEIFPNLFVIFVGPPGSGKTMAAIRGAGTYVGIKTKTRAGDDQEQYILAPDSTTLRALTMKLAANPRTFPIPDTKSYITQCAMTFVSEELGNLFNSDPVNMINALNQCYDARDYTHETAHHGTDKVKNVCLNLLGCTTPDFMTKPINRDLLGGGFNARVIYVFASGPRFKKAKIEISTDQLVAYQSIGEHVKNLAKLVGPVQFSDEAEEFFTHWYEKESAIKRINRDPKLDSYYARKKLHVRKLAAAIHFADNLSLIIEIDSVKGALGFLQKTEIEMHLAVAGIGRNPLWEVAETVKGLIRGSEGGKCTKKYIRVKTYSIANAEELNAAIDFLITTDQLAVEPGSTDVVFKLKEP